MTPPVTVQEFKSKFARQFVFGGAPDTVTGDDITGAMNDALLMFNPSMWADTNELKVSFLYLTAHLVALNIQAAGGLGLSMGEQNAGGGPITQRSVGNVSLAYQLPERITNNPALAEFLRTDFGCRYLQIAAPRMIGNMGNAVGWDDTGLPSGA